MNGERQWMCRVVMIALVLLPATGCNDGGSSPTEVNDPVFPLTLHVTVENAEGLATIEWVPVALRSSGQDIVIGNFLPDALARSVEGDFTTETQPGNKTLFVEFLDRAGAPFSDQATVPNNYRLAATANWRGTMTDLGTVVQLVESRLSLNFTLP